MAEQRKERRCRLSASLVVYDGISSRVVGRIVDLTPTGMMLACDEPVGIQEEFCLRIRFPEPLDGREEFMVRGTCRWCREAQEPDRFVAGFQLQDLEAGGQRFFTVLLNTFCQPE